MNSKSFASIVMSILMATTLLQSCAEAKKVKRKTILRGLIGAGLLLKYATPRKGILPIPLPLPVPLNIDVPHSPVVVHPKHHPVSIPHPLPVPVHIPVHFP